MSQITPLSSNRGLVGEPKESKNEGSNMDNEECNENASSQDGRKRPLPAPILKQGGKFRNILLKIAQKDAGPISESDSQHKLLPIDGIEPQGGFSEMSTSRNDHQLGSDPSQHKPEQERLFELQDMPHIPKPGNTDKVQDTESGDEDREDFKQIINQMPAGGRSPGNNGLLSLLLPKLKELNNNPEAQERYQKYSLPNRTDKPHSWRRSSDKAIRRWNETGA